MVNFTTSYVYPVFIAVMFNVYVIHCLEKLAEAYVTQVRTQLTHFTTPW